MKTLRDYINLIESAQQGVAEGLGKDIKRGMAGWGAFDKDKPADVVKRVKGQDTDTLKTLSRTGPTGKGSPAELQQKAISRELKKRGEQGVAEGDVVKFPKKHKGDLSDTHDCPKCGGDLQGGKYMGHQVKVCMPCKQVYLPPNSGIDQKGNKIDEYGDTAKGQKMLTKVQKRAVDRVTSKKADTDPKYAKKNSDTANRAWDRMADKD